MFQAIVTLLEVGGALLALLFVLLALPQSKLREFCLPIVAWTFAIGAGVYVISPLDAVPDVIPVIGWVDDIAAAAVGIGAAAAALTHKK